MLELERLLLTFHETNQDNPPQTDGRPKRFSRCKEREAVFRRDQAPL
jgi:hypothetical protein